MLRPRNSKTTSKMDKNKKYRWGIRTKFSLALGLLVLISLASFGLFSYIVTRKTLERQMENSLINHAELAAGMMGAVLLVEWLPEIYISGNSFYYNILREKLVSVNTEVADLDNIILIGSGNKVIVDAEGNLPIGKELTVLKADQVELRSSWEGKSDASVLFPGKDGRPHKSAYAPVFSKDRNVIAVIRVEASAKFLDTVNRVVFVLLITALVITALGALLGIIIARSVVNPIKKLVRASESISAGNLDTEVNINSKDEIGFFAETFNQMAKNLKKLYEEVSEHSRQIAELSASVAHEVRSPISAIQGFTELLEDELDEDDPRREYINDIKEEIKDLNSKVTNFIHFARPLAIEPGPLDITEVLESAMASVDKEATDNEIAITCQFDDELPPVLGDSEQLRGLFVNLMRNSIQSMRYGGNIDIDINPPNGNSKAKKAKDDYEFMEITISDDGSGMSPDNLKKAFDPFFTTKADGTGLGLPICKKIVNAHNGEIKLESVLGEGTTVKVLLPCLDQSEY
jgi:signal transduction histidine kinase